MKRDDKGRIKAMLTRADNALQEARRYIGDARTATHYNAAPQFRRYLAAARLHLDRAEAAWKEAAGGQT